MNPSAPARSRGARAAEHPPGARNVLQQVSVEPAGQLAPDQAAPVVIYCSGPYCNRSKTAATAFTRLRYAHVRVYVGGKEKRTQAGLAFESGRAPAPTSMATSAASAAGPVAGRSS
ncbi:rhodanese-like domain-containing protein [Nonomuraea sp. NPDC049709]|uniref:rhodanese-like domain-containing protein n=1 Tax=Nonomuraea sp. NPDC049709 TaxID=3154736 RepID=UPI003420D55A